MTRWGHGYTTDITYTTGYYREQAPGHAGLACVLNGVTFERPGPHDAFSFLELGCGNGFNALVMAASNPGWRVTAIDFNPAHIAAANTLKAAAGLTNVTFLEADLSTLAEEPAVAAVPMADAVSMHGLWSWVPPGVRDGVIRLLRARVNPGGIVHVSYNVLPGWHGGIAMQRLVLEAGQRRAARSDKQAEAGFAVVRRLYEADAHYLKSSKIVQGLMERPNSLPPEYAAHEYMNNFWAPCFHADVAEAMSGAKLDWVAACSMLENFPELVMTEPQRAVLAEFDDPVMRELVKDICLERTLRHDVFVRGVRRLDTAGRNAALGEVGVALLVPAAEFEYEINMPVGTASFERRFYEPIVRELDAGPRRIGDMLALPGLEGRRDNPAELVGVLIGTGQATDAAAIGASQDAGALRLNRAVAHHMVRPAHITRGLALASTVLGSGMPATGLDIFMWDRMRQGEGEAHLDAWVAWLGFGADAENQEKLRGAFRRGLEFRVPIWRQIGLL